MAGINSLRKPHQKQLARAVTAATAGARGEDAVLGQRDVERVSGVNAAVAVCFRRDAHEHSLEERREVAGAVVGVVGVGSNWSAAARRVVAGLEQGRLLRLRRRRGLGVGEHN